MNGKENIGNISDGEEDKVKKSGEVKDLKLPFDMKSFWKNVNEKYFKNVNEINVNDINHLVQLYSKYDINHDHIFTKIGFPKTINCLMGKPQEILARKNNPLLYTKFFGMYIYLDKYDYSINNLNNEDIDEEIDAIEDKLRDLGENNIFYLKNFKSKLNRIKSVTKLDLNDNDTKDKRLQNISNQIFMLQMRQFAESISNIKKDVKKNKFVLLFDGSENIDPLTLEEYNYKELLKYRDMMNSISVYDLFQEKIHFYYNVNTSDKEAKKKKGKQEKNVKNTKYIKKNSKSNNNIKANSKTKQSKLNGKNKKEEDIQIAKVVNINYNFCHHCKQRKPAEVMVKCSSINCSKFIEKPIKNFYVNNTTVVRKLNKNFIITNYVGDPKDILDGYLAKKSTQSCGRTFCHFCLKGSYDQIIEQVKIQKDWVCPWCAGICFCSRCIRYDQILKLISLYISLDGDINILYDELIEKSLVLDKLSMNLLISNIIIIKNDPSIKTNIKLPNIYAGKKDYEEIENIIDQSYKYRDHFIDLKNYFDMVFDKARQEKILLNIDKRLTDICSLYHNKNDHVLLSKKQKRKAETMNNIKDKDDLIEAVKEHVGCCKGKAKTKKIVAGKQTKTKPIKTGRIKLGKSKHSRLAKSLE